MGKINRIKESIETYRMHFLTLDIEIVKKLLKQYEFERVTGLSLNTKKIIALKQVITLRCCPKCGGDLKYQETGCMPKNDEWIECISCDYSRDLTDKDIEIIYDDY